MSSWKDVSGDDKVRACIEMTDFIREVCAAGIRASNPDISEEELAAELRRRLEWSKRKKIDLLRRIGIILIVGLYG